jgi:6-phosphofructokinase 1
MRIGILTGGGDCPGLNATIRAIVRTAKTRHNAGVIGFLDAWDGVMERRFVDLELDAVRGILPLGGTILGTRRGSPLDHAEGPRLVADTVRDLDLDGLIVIGGDGSLMVASILHEQIGLPVVGIPKTIDNDVMHTDVTIGFNTAVQVATDSIDRLYTTAESHNRAAVVEVMGRDAGWIAFHAGIAGGATTILIPERPFNIEEVAEHVANRHRRGRYASIVVVAEGARAVNGSMEMPTYSRDIYGRERLGGVGAAIASALEERTNIETRLTILGQVQRGGTPNATDRILATRFGLAAVEAVASGYFGCMMGLQHGTMVHVPLRDVAGQPRCVNLDLYGEISDIFFG